VSVDVLITGVVHSATEPPAVVLARVLGMPPDQARRVARTFPSMLVTGATRAHAESVASQLREGGIKVEVVDRDATARPAPSPAPTRAERSVERPVARKSGPREVREERGVASAPRHRDAFEERASRTVDVPAKHRDMFEERPSRTMDAPLKHRDMFEERPSRTIDAPAKYRDALEERMGKAEAKPAKHRDALEERMARSEAKPAKHRDALEERLAKAEAAPAKHRDALEERMSRGDPLPQKPLPTPAPAPAPAPVPAPEPAPAPAPVLFEDRPSRAQPMPFLQDSFDAPAAPAFPAFAGEPDPFSPKSAFGALDFERAPPTTTTPRTTADFGSLDEVFGAAPADTAVRRGLEPKRPVAADAAVESLFEVPSAGKPVQVRPRQMAPSADSRERAGDRPAGQERPAAVAPMMAMSFDEPAGKSRRWLWTLVGLSLLIGGIVFARGQDGHEMHSGAAWGQADDVEGRPANQLHFLVRMAPRGIDRSMAMVLRQLVDGLHKVQITNDDFPADAQCLLVRGDDGKRQERLDKLLRTGVALPLDEAKRQEFAEHQESLRQALGDAKLSFTPICLSVDAWVAQQEAAKSPGG
jgi:hypothetical protein